MLEQKQRTAIHLAMSSREPLVGQFLPGFREVLQCVLGSL